MFQKVKVKNKKGTIKMSDFREFWDKYKGAIIGVVIAILIMLTKLYKLFILIVLIVIGAIIGNYVQNNKELVKDKLKSFIDRF